MRAPELKTVAAGLAEAGAPGLPTVILAREIPLYEVEFAALEFAEDVKLPSSDWAALALARALGEISPADVDAYLGLGEAVSEGLVRRLLDDALLEDSSGVNVVTLPVAAQESGLGAFFRRLFGSKAPPVETITPPQRPATAARTLRDSRASTSPLCRLSAGGTQALESGALSRRRVRPARLLFVADPLLFLGVVDEKRQRHTQHRRATPLEPDRVPEPLRVLDETFALPADERIGACGIESSIRGFAGRLVGVVPGAQWEVRQFERRGGKGREQQFALMVLAGFPSSDAEGLLWRAYLRQHAQTNDCPHIDAARVVERDLRGVHDLLKTVAADTPLPDPGALRADGAFEMRCDRTLLPVLLGEADRADDTFLPALAMRWWVGLRAHAMPLNIEAAHAAFYDFLRRRDGNLRRNFDATCVEVATSLTTYWGENPGLPSPDEAAIELWAREELRAALCMRRQHGDLVAPYENAEAP